MRTTNQARPSIYERYENRFNLGFFNFWYSLIEINDSSANDLLM